MKKRISIILIIAICISMPAFSASADTEPAVEAEIIEALHVIECVKGQFGLSSVDFKKLTYSDPIYAYDYTAEGVQYNSEFIPIIHNDSLIGWVIKANAETDAIYQFSNAFVPQVNSIVNENTNFAIVYGRSASYLYDGIQLYKLGDISAAAENRAVLNEASVLDNSDIVRNNFLTRYDLQYTSPDTNARTPVYYECGVPFVSQNPPSVMCWAASVASITNFLKGTNHTAVSVAQKWYNTTAYNGYNKKLGAGLEKDVLKTYGISYTYKNEIPSDGVILKNIRSGYPVYATFRNGTSNYHSVVIYGINITGGYIYIMDPKNGFLGSGSANSVGRTYYNEYEGLTYTLNRATCKYWTP